jgi:hypothetical protein
MRHLKQFYKEFRKMPQILKQNKRLLSFSHIICNTRKLVNQYNSFSYSDKPASRLSIA